MDKNLWLFNYEQGLNYEKFSKCEDYKNQILEYLNKNYDFSRKTILEIGAGSGKFTRFLAQNCENLIVVEKSASLHEINQDKNKDLSNTCFYNCDIKDFLLPDKSIDFIFGGWSMTSMRDMYDILIPKFKRMLKDDGKIILVENAGQDEFCKLMNIESFTEEMKDVYKNMGFEYKKELNTQIVLPDKKVFYNAFPAYQDLSFNDLVIKHNVCILEAQKNKLKLYRKENGYENC